MENLDNKLLGEKIRKIRESRNLTLKELGRALGVSESTVSKLENGDRRLKGEEIPVLFRILNCTSMELFGEEELPIIQEISTKLRASNWVSSNSKIEVQKILSRLGRQIKNLIELEHTLGIGLDEQCPSKNLPVPASDREQISQADLLANFVRRNWSLGSDPIWNLEALLEQHSIVWTRWPLPEELSGICAPYQNRPIIVIDSQEPVQRQRLTLCHELCHAIVDISSGVVLTRKDKSKKGRDKYSNIEKRADIFAGKLLLPLEAAHTFANQEGLDLSNLTGYAAMRLAYYFGISRLAVLHTLKNYGVINWRTLNKIKEEMHKLDTSELEKRPYLEIWCDNLAQEIQSIPRLVRLGFHAYFNYKINVGALAGLLDVPRSDLTKPLKEYKKNFSELLCGITAG